MRLTSTSTVLSVQVRLVLLLAFGTSFAGACAGVKNIGQQGAGGGAFSGAGGNGGSNMRDPDAGIHPDRGPMTLPRACGNGERTTDEACDDGNQIDGDGCSATCL